MGLGRGQLAGLPEQEKLFQAGEDAGQAGHNQGVDGGRNPGTLLLPCPRAVAQAGELVAEGGRMILHREILPENSRFVKKNYRL